MTDGIIKGTGNSRYLKSVANALVLYPTHESLMEALAAGTLPIDLNGINPAGWNNVGDKLDKATLLTDALCSALGLSTTATPTQAMDKLRTLVNTAQSTANNKIRMQQGTYTGNGNENKMIYLPFTPAFIIIGVSKSVSGLYAFNGLSGTTSNYNSYVSNVDFGPNYVSISGDVTVNYNAKSIDYGYACFGY